MGGVKKILLSVLTLATLSTASAAEKFGAYLLGVQYQRDTNATDAVRFGLGLPLAAAFNGGGFVTVSGDVSYLRHTAPETESVQPYYGGSLGLLGLFATSGGDSAGAVGVFPSVLGGANVNVTDQVGLFGELGVGPRVIFVTGGGSDWTFGVGARLGVNYRLR